MRIFSVLVLVVLAGGCSSTAGLLSEHDDKSALRPQGMVDDPALEPLPRPLQAEKPPDPRTTGVNLGYSGEKSGSLMDCDEACRKNCSVKNQSRPKWCGLYKPPAS
jgi:hypothetical protein